MPELVQHTHVGLVLHDAFDGGLPCIQECTIIRENPYDLTVAGSLADIHKCTWNSSAGSVEVAVKSPRLANMNEDEATEVVKNLHQDVRIWMTLEHRFLLPFYGTVGGFGRFRGLVSPWMPNGNLKLYLRHAGATLKEMDKLYLLRQITQGLKYLHDKNMVHGNLTSSNILIATDGSPRLADFGFSSIVRQSNPTFSYYPGALRWIPPEFIINSREWLIQDGTKSGDIYALGGIILQVLYGKKPYWWLNNPGQIVNAKCHNIEPINSSIRVLPDHLRLMKRCWSADSSGRPSVDDVLKSFNR